MGLKDTEVETSKNLFKEILTEMFLTDLQKRVKGWYHNQIGLEQMYLATLDTDDRTIKI